MQKLFYSSTILLCCLALTTPVAAKGKPFKNKNQTTQHLEQSHTSQAQSSLCQQRSSSTQQTGRSNKGGKVRGLERAKQVQQLQLAKNRQSVTRTPGLSSSCLQGTQQTTTQESFTQTQTQVETQQTQVQK
jgi:hypothetical protein